MVHLQIVQNCNFDSFRRQRGSTEIEVSKQIQHARLDSSKHFSGPKSRPLPRSWPRVLDLHPYLANIMLIYPKVIIHRDLYLTRFISELVPKSQSTTPGQFIKMTPTTSSQGKMDSSNCLTNLF